jgi:hypothetical protein
MPDAAMLLGSAPEPTPSSTSLTYPLTKTLLPHLDALVAITGVSREASAFFALGLIAVIAEYVTQGKGGGVLDKVELIVHGTDGERVAGTMSSLPTQGRFAEQRIRISFPSVAPPTIIPTMAEWLGCTKEDVLIHAVIWTRDAITTLRQDEAIVLRCALGTKVELYSRAHHARLMERLESMQHMWEGDGGVVKVESVWDEL